MLSYDDADFSQCLIQLSNISGSNLSSGVASHPLGTVDLTLPKGPPTNPQQVPPGSGFVLQAERAPYWSLSSG